MGAELPDYQSYFNSRPHGGRQARPIFFDASRDFNSRPHGGRLQPVADQIHLKNFNSRPHGGRREKSVNFPVWLISTHALTEGDEHGYQIADSNSIFQLTPSRRATKAFTADVVDLAFQLTPSRRATAERTTLFDCVVYFNSRPHGGRHPYRLGAVRVSLDFNSRPHGGRQEQIWKEISKENISTHALTEGDALAL